MDGFRNKLSLRFLAVTMVGVLVSLAAGCENTQEVQKPDQKKLPAIERTARKTDIPPARTDQSPTETQLANEKKPTEPQWIGEPVALFDGKSLEGWETIEFGGEGECSIVGGQLTFGEGDPFTGISSTSDSLPKTNYEVSLEARKMDGTDFFCGFTFPVADSHCTLIVGGWGGSTVGLSCIDEQDAARNETCAYMKFEKKQWYKIRIRVQPETISVWIDDEPVVNQNIAGKKISLRGDTELCKPMGICSFMTVAEYRNIQLRQFKPIEDSAESGPADSASKSEAVKQK